MNAGAYGGEMKEVIETVTLLHRDGSGMYRLTCGEMEYGYRHSVLYEILAFCFKGGSRERKRVQGKTP